MGTAGHQATLEERIARLELSFGEDVAALDRRTDGLESRLRGVEARLLGSRDRSVDRPTIERPAAWAPVSPRVRRDPPTDRRSGGDQPRGGGAAMRTGQSGSSAAAPAVGRQATSGQSLGDLIGGRVLAWIGGVATLLGIVLFLALAISHGWIGEQARVALAGLASATLMAGGVWLHGRRGRTEAARTMVGVATAGLFATLVVASEMYGLIPALASVCVSMVIGALASALAIRWAGRVIGALGLVGALLSPVLAGAQPSLATTVVLAVAGACAMYVVVRQRWSWLGIVTVLICAPQWGNWVGGQAAALVMVVAGAFGAFGLAGSVGADLRRTDQRVQPSWALLVVLNALLVAGAGYFAVREAGGATTGELWLAGLAAVHVAVGLWPERLASLSQPTRQILVAVGVILADVAFALTAGGPVLGLGWAATAVGFAWLARRAAPDSGDRSLLGLGLGAHVALVLTRALLAAPPADLGTSDVSMLGLLSVSTLAATSMACARITDPALRAWRVALDSLGLLAVAYLTAATLDGPALAVAWAVEGLALAQIARRSRDDVARYGSLAFLAGAALHCLILEAPPAGLLTGVSDLGAAAIALGTLALATLRAAYAHPAQTTQRRRLTAAAGAAVLYLASVAIISAFQPGSADTIDTVLDLSVRQQGQVLLSTVWSLVGLIALIIGLRAKLPALRSAALGLLLITVAKVFLYDLSTLSSIYRVASFIALGLLLLAGAYAYQRLRPPPAPDLRTLHPSQR
jgi:uncharacterized membrane protein